MATENIVTGRKYRILSDAVNQIWDKISFWSKASDTEANDGNTLEYKVGAINGITDALDSEDSSIAASSVAVKTLNDSLGGISQFIVDETTGKISGYKTEIGGADTVFPFSGGNFQLDIVINVGCTNYTGTEWYEKTLTVTYINGEINYDETWQNYCTNTGSDMSWSTGVAKITSITYTAL